MAAQQPADYTIICTILDKNRPFVVDISPHKIVAHLKKAIKSERQAFDNIDADDLDLYLINLANDGSLIEEVEKLLAGHPPPCRSSLPKN
jgi:Crinkler effector protein N-terminal domain